MNKQENYFDILKKKGEIFLENIKNNLPELEKLYEEINGHWVYEDLIYRFYHYSYKLYHIQTCTTKIVNELKKLAPEKTKMNSLFEKIFNDGTGKVFATKHNKDWEKHTRPMIEAFFHAKYFLEMCIKYGKELEKAPEYLPSGWAGALYLFGIR